MKGTPKLRSDAGARSGATSSGPAGVAPAPVWRDIHAVLAKVEGVFGLSYLHLGSGESYTCNGDELFYPCSVIKVPIMCEVFRQAEKGQLDLARKIVVNRDDQVGGSGILQVLTPGAELPVYDLITLMIVVSDNAATNMLIDLVGMDSVNDLMRQIGLPDIRLYHKLMVIPVDRKSVNLMSPDATTGLMARIARNQVVSMRACESMIRILKQQQYHDHLTKYLPLEPEPGHATGSLPRVEVAHKNGWTDGNRCCTGIFYLPGQEYVLSVFFKNVKDNRAADEAIAQVGKLVYDWRTAAA